jgi:hypothetical protein
MTEIVEFIKARLNDDEAAAYAANGPEWTTPGDDGPGEGMLYAVDGSIRGTYKSDGWCIAQFESYPRGYANSPDSPGYLPAFPTTRIRHIENGVHAARHDPARVLREVAGKRRIVEEYLLTEASLRHEAEARDRAFNLVSFEAAEYALRIAIRALAAAYADHPDYRKEWAL